MSFIKLCFDKVNPLADFYAGYAEKTMGVSMQHELSECMTRNDDATYLWDLAIG